MRFFAKVRRSETWRAALGGPAEIDSLIVATGQQPDISEGDPGRLQVDVHAYNSGYVLHSLDNTCIDYQTSVILNNTRRE